MVTAEEPLADRVRTSIDRGLAFLKKKQENRGGEWNWENSTLALAWKGGTTCLATLAMLTCGVKPAEPVIQRTLPYIRKLMPDKNYVLALQAMVLAEVGEAKDKDIIQRNVNLLLEGRVYVNGKFVGWSYTKSPQPDSDNSNTQYALLGLLAGRQAGIKIPEKDWEEIRDFYMRTQIVTEKAPEKVGGWGYKPELGAVASSPSHTMTLAGLAGLYISGLELNVGKQQLILDGPDIGVARQCGVYSESDAIAIGTRWLARHFSFSSQREMHQATFYNVYGIERVGRLSGQRFIGEHDWYREGCEWLCGVKRSPLNQHEDGSWGAELKDNLIDNLPVLSTSFSLLFLSKGRTPILISKMAYDIVDKKPNEWNRKHNDARHMVEYASKALFKNQPLAWQVFDPRFAELTTETELKDELESLLQAPILYMNGHYAPQLTPRQIELLRRYMDEGGFIFAEACCGSPEFADGFRILMDKVFKKESPLVEMRDDHPIWSAHMPLNPIDFKANRKKQERIQCIERGCKTVVVFTPQPLAGFWEESRFMPKNQLPPTTRGELAYRFAGNIIAYATGLEMPKPRLSRVQLNDLNEEKVISRQMLRIGQIRHDGDWNPAPQAMRNLSTYLRDKYRLDIALSKDEVKPGDLNIMQHKFLYMHGRREMTFDDDEIKNIRMNLRTGGTLLADACCGSHEFDKGFRTFMEKLYPKNKLEPIPQDDYLFSERLTGSAITTVKCRRDLTDGKASSTYEEMKPELEGIKIGNRWVVIYSKYDLGCALEKSKSSACRGYDHDSALKLASAAVLYFLNR